MKKLSISQKVKAKHRLYRGADFYVDLELFKEKIPNSTLNNNLARVNKFSKTALHSQMLYALLDVVSEEEIQAFRKEHQAKLEEQKAAEQEAARLAIEEEERLAAEETDRLAKEQEAERLAKEEAAAAKEEVSAEQPAEETVEDSTEEEPVLRSIEEPSEEAKKKVNAKKPKSSPE